MRARLPISMARITVAALLLAGCLPGDTRPPPAAIHLTVEPSPAVTEGFTTVDGWHVSFERLLVGIGDAALGSPGEGNERIEDSACVGYANARYERLFDFTVAGRQTLSDIYGIGKCGVIFGVTAPYFGSTPLGTGVSIEDLAFMRDSAHLTARTNHARSVYVRGKATRETITKRFEWSFEGLRTFRGCVGTGGVGFASDVILTSSAELPLPVVVHGEELFHETHLDESPLRFDALAAADVNGDQMITLEELSDTVDPSTEADAGFMSVDGGAPSIGDLISRRLVIRMFRIGDSGPCLGAYQ